MVRVNIDFNGITEFPDYLSTLTELTHLTLAARNRTYSGEYIRHPNPSNYPCFRIDV